MKPEIKIFQNTEEIANYLGTYLTELSQRKNEVFIALSGGNTPKTIFKTLSHQYQNKIDWSNLRFFWGDERCVPPTHRESNFGMTREHLFDFVPVSGDYIFRIKGELSAEQASTDYRNCILENVPLDKNIPQFDLILLGMGDDGHTASIFPHQINLWDSANICETATHPDTGQQRVTLTGNVINNAKQIIFLITGSNKSEKIKEILNEAPVSKNYPAALADKAKSLWLLDDKAANLIK
ncbi:6-phosphogluconolactonase [Marinilabiliaceae bacterium JC017]|nr:6-phosphogluconolactonase [Marinilabiliaceae bacterium JC017]